jgi:hypothetical protein
MMPAERLILIRHSGLRVVTEQEVLATLTTEEAALPREIVHVDTTSFADDVAAGDWARSALYLRERAAEILRLADADPRTPELRYFGLAEIPHVIALGAFISDERFVRVFDFDRTRDSWSWPGDVNDATLAVGSEGVPAERLTQPGVAIVRIAVSAAISDMDIEIAAGRDSLADVTISATSTIQQVGVVRSPADVEAIRRAAREAFAAVNNARPGVETVDLFVAASVAVCFVVGQELHLRNAVPVQTFRFRKSETEPAYTAAIRLSSAEAVVPTPELSDAERATAAHVRTIWSDALRAVHTFADLRKDEAPEDVRWYQTLGLPELSAMQPFPGLPPVWQVIDSRDTVDATPFDREYGLDKDAHRWRLGDRLLVGLQTAAGDDATLKRLIQLFLFHEYLHEHHSLTKYTATDVGSYPNCLEHVDYTADLYALLHQLGWARIYDRERVATAEQQRVYLVEQVDLILRSFWAFDGPFPMREWQVRRLRRYLNWYWRLTQIKRAPDLDTALRVLGRAPAIELAGVRQRVRERRHFADLTKPAPGDQLTLALVLEDERLLRVANSVVTNLDELLRAFRDGDHASIVQFFNSVYEDAKNWGGAFPKKLP